MHGEEAVMTRKFARNGGRRRCREVGGRNLEVAIERREREGQKRRREVLRAQLAADRDNGRRQRAMMRDLIEKRIDELVDDDAIEAW